MHCAICGEKRASATKEREFVCLYCRPGRAPGVIGLDHPNEVNPDKYDPAKERRLALKYMNQTSGANHLDNQQAEFVAKYMLKPEEAAQAQREAMPRAQVETQAALAREEAKESQRQFQQEQAAFKLRMEKKTRDVFTRLKKAQRSS